MDYNCSAIVVDGKLEYTCFLYDLPLKYRGVEITLTPLIFCETKKLTEENYMIDQEFEIDTDIGDYYTSYNGTEVLLFDGYNDGLITYIKVLTEGGEKTDRNKPIYSTAYLQNNECTINTYDFVDNDDNILKPVYDISVIGYLSWVTIE